MQLFSIIQLAKNVFTTVVLHSDSYRDAFTTVGPIMMICQLAGILEILHPLLGWVKTGAIMPIIQV